MGRATLIVYTDLTFEGTWYENMRHGISMYIDTSYSFLTLHLDIFRDASDGYVHIGEYRKDKYHGKDTEYNA